MLSFAEQGVTDDSAVHVADSLRAEAGAATGLDLRHNLLHARGAQTVGDALAKARVATLLLSDNRLGAAGVAALASSMGAAAAARLRVLDLSLNELDAEAGAALLPMVTAAAASLALTSVDLSVNLLTDAAGAELVRALEAAAGLQRLLLRSAGVADETAAAVAALLARDESRLAEVALGGNRVGDAGAQALARGLRRNTALDKLDLEDCAVGDAGVRALSALLRAWPQRSFAELALARNPAPQEARAELHELLQTNRLRAFVAQGAGGGDLSGDVAEGLLGALLEDWHVATLAALVREAGGESSYPVLDLTRNRVGARGAATLGVWLCVDPALVDLRLARNEIGDAGAEALALALRENCALTALDVAHNGISDRGLYAIAEALHQNEATRVRALRCEGNRGSPRAEQAMRAAQDVNRFRERLAAVAGDARIDLRGANLHHLSAPILVDALCAADACADLCLARNHLGDSGAVLLAERYLARSQTLATLDLSGNEVADAGAVAIAAALRHNQSLTALVLVGGTRGAHTRIGDRGAAAIAKALLRNSTLTLLDLSGNAVRTRGAEALANAIVHTTSLLKLIIADNGTPIDGKQALKRAASGATVLKKLALT